MNPMLKTIVDANNGLCFYCVNCDLIIGKEKQIPKDKWGEARDHLSEHPDHQIYDVFVDQKWPSRINDNTTWFLTGKGIGWETS